jgi:hypothetical protein
MKINSVAWRIVILILSVWTLPVQSAQRSVLPGANKEVMIYDGMGACNGCADSPAELVRSLGYSYRFVQAESINAALLRTTRLWIQPGGEALDDLAAKVCF